MILKKILFTLIAINFIGAGVLASSLDLYQIQSCEIPGITKISEYTFGNEKVSGESYILVRSGQRLLLYSKSTDSILYEVTLRDAREYKIALGDINKDDVLDMIVAMSFDVSGKSDSAAVIELYNTGYESPTEVVYYNNYDFERPGQYGGDHIKQFTIEALAVSDLNNDSSDNLVFSYKGALGYSYGGWDANSEFFGHIVIYNEFPNDTMAYSEQQFFSSPITIRNGCTPAIIGTKHQSGYSYDIGPSPDGSQSWLINSIIFYNYADSEFYHLHSTKYSSCAFSESRSFTNKYDLLLCANINPSSCQYEMLLNYQWWTTCMGPYQTYTPISGNENYYGWITGDYIEADTLEPAVYSHYAFHPDYPNTYFALADGNFRQFEASTNNEIEVLPTIPSGNLNWEYPDDSSTPFLVAVNGNTIDLYALMSPTSTENDNPVLPVSLSLGPAMPNPFNASQTIPVRIDKTGAHLNVSIYNLLGEKVDLLYDGIMHDTEIEFEWNAGSFPSGIYFIRAQSGAEVSVIKSVLIK
ncbi:MAG: T9SS type A sorting domain-containing protein [Candidatus Zixiibacteriota bacterium]